MSAPWAMSCCTRDEMRISPPSAWSANPRGEDDASAEEVALPVECLAGVDADACADREVVAGGTP
jgi:hypothetical protein